MMPVSSRSVSRVMPKSKRVHAGARGRMCLRICVYGCAFACMFAFACVFACVFAYGIQRFV